MSHHRPRAERAATLALGGMLLACASGCGDALVDASYLGEPLVVINGNVNLQTAPEEASYHELRVALFWSSGHTLGQTNYQALDSIEHPVVTLTSFPARYEMRVYEPPPLQLMTALPEPNEGAATVANVLLYDDVDRDGRWDQASERLVGGSTGGVLLFTPAGVRGDLILTEEPEEVGEIAPGFHVVVPELLGACEGESDFVPLYLQSTPQVDLFVVDDYGDIFFDFNCDEQLDEWCSICHPGWDEICSDVPEECGPEGPFAHCPECPPWEP